MHESLPLLLLSRRPSPWKVWWISKPQWGECNRAAAAQDPGQFSIALANSRPLSYPYSSTSCPQSSCSCPSSFDQDKDEEERNVNSHNRWLHHPPHFWHPHRSPTVHLKSEDCFFQGDWSKCVFQKPASSRQKSDTQVWREEGSRGSRGSTEREMTDVIESRTPG